MLTRSSIYAAVAYQILMVPCLGPTTTPPDTKFEDVPPMPDYWGMHESTRFPNLKAGLLFIGVGRTTAKERWARTHTGSPFYQQGRDGLGDRVTHINVVVSIGFYRRVYELLTHDA